MVRLKFHKFVQFGHNDNSLWTHVKQEIIHVGAMWVIWCDLHGLIIGHKVDIVEEEIREVVVVVDG